MRIDYPKTPEDDSLVKRDLLTNKTLKHLSNLSFYKFSVGDVLVREDRHRNYQTQTDEWKIHESPTGVLYRYVYVFENELGVGYVRRLSVDGKRFVEVPICTVEFDPAETRFRLDSGYADSIILGDDAGFDPRSDYKETKKRREAVYRANDKICEKTDTVEEVIAFLKKLKVGDHVWSGWSRTAHHDQPTVVVSINIDAALPEKSSVDLNSGVGFGNCTVRYNAERIRDSHWYLTKPQSPNQTI